MKIQKIKEIHWWDPKSRSDAVTYKVWVEDSHEITLFYFTDKSQLDNFIKELDHDQESRPKTSTRRGSNKI